MKRIGICVSLLVLSIGAVQAGPPGIDLVSPLSKTHTGRHYLEHVTLTTGGGNIQTCPSGTLTTFRKGPDGTGPQEEFVVPPDKVLVLTDFFVGFRERFSDDWVPGGGVISVQLQISPPDEPPSGSIWQTTVQIDGVMAASETAFFHEHLTSGVVIGSGQRPCLRMGFSTIANLNTVIPLNLSKMHGYLVDE